VREKKEIFAKMSTIFEELKTIYSDLHFTCECRKKIYIKNLFCAAAAAALVLVLFLIMRE
jgi:hypothetical protein